MHCAETAEDIDTISFAHNSPISLQVMIKFGLQCIDQLIAPKLCPKVTYDGEIAAEWLDIAHCFLCLYIYHVLYFNCKFVRLSHSFIKGYLT